MKNKQQLFLKILNQFSWVFFGNIVFALSQWFIIIVMTNHGNDIDLGYYTYALALISPIFMFFTFDLRRVFATSSKGKDLLLTFLINRIIHMLLASMAILILTFFLDINTIIIKVILLLTLFKFIEYISDIIFGYFQQSNLQDLIGKSQLLRGIISLLSFSIVYIITNNLVSSLIVLNIVMLLRLIFFDVKKAGITREYIRKNLSLKDIKFKIILLTNLSLGFTLLVNSLLVNVPRYYIEYFYDITLVGYFSAIYYILIAASMIINPVTTMLAPYLRLNYEKSSKSLWFFLVKSIILICSLSFIFSLFLLLFTDEILLFLYNDNFLIYNTAFKVLIYSIVFSFANGILGLTLITLKKNQLIFYISMINLFITILLGYFLINNFGLTGASFTILVSRVFSFTSSLITIYFILRFRVPYINK